jgi:hypothetical protein
MQMNKNTVEKVFHKVPLGLKIKPGLFWLNLLINDLEKDGSQQYIN